MKLDEAKKVLEDNGYLLENAYNQWRERDFKSRGWHGGTNGLEGALDNSSKMNEITEALADVVYDAIKDIQIEQA